MEIFNSILEKNDKQGKNKKSSLSRDRVSKILSKIIDPELGLSITKTHLIDNIIIRDSIITVDFHLTTPFSPPMFASMIAQDIKERLYENGAKKVFVRIRANSKNQRKYIA